jgi:hypothetical protein
MANQPCGGISLGLSAERPRSAWAAAVAMGSCRSSSSRCAQPMRRQARSLLPSGADRQRLVVPRVARRGAVPLVPLLVQRRGARGRTRMHKAVSGTRAIALVGPAGAGKTCLVEAILHASGAIDRQGSTANGTSVGDCSPEARARGGSTELNLMNFDWLGERYALLDLPGGTGFAGRWRPGARGCGPCHLGGRPRPRRAPLAAPTLRLLDGMGIPHLIFVNRIEACERLDRRHPVCARARERSRPCSRGRSLSRGRTR